jgi:hypothetical protein
VPDCDFQWCNFPHVEQASKLFSSNTQISLSNNFDSAIQRFKQIRLATAHRYILNHLSVSIYIYIYIYIYIFFFSFGQLYIKKLVFRWVYRDCAFTNYLRRPSPCLVNSDILYTHHLYIFYISFFLN